MSSLPPDPGWQARVARGEMREYVGTRWRTRPGTEAPSFERENQRERELAEQDRRELERARIEQENKQAREIEEQARRERSPYVISVGIGAVLSSRLALDPELVYQLTPDQFEELICDRLYAMGMEPKRVGAVNRKDGGIDILFWPRFSAFPFLCAAQVKHHRDPRWLEGPASVRDFSGAIAGQRISAGLLVTNTRFTPDAEWFARERTQLVRLRDFGDLKRWLVNRFDHPDEWREIPSSLEVCPGVVVKLR